MAGRTEREHPSLRAIGWLMNHWWVLFAVVVSAVVVVDAVNGDTDSRQVRRGVITTSTTGPDDWLEQSEYEEWNYEDPSAGVGDSYEPPDYDAGFP